MSDEKDKALAAARKRSEEDTREQMLRQSYQPTPTQEENDRAKLGVESLDQLDDKDDSGAPDESEARAADLEARAASERSTSASGGAAYSTRASSPKK